MKQVLQNNKSGSVSVEEVPVPSLRDNWVLVRNRCSVISAGTEKTKIDFGKKGLLAKARSRPDLVKQVLAKIKTDGLGKTLATVNTRLASPAPLGYSSAGEVVAVGGLVEGILPGDRVACGGAGYANHAELVAVPKNLVVRMPECVLFEDAAFTTLGSIALQGVRLVAPDLGETFLVIGLGLLGQIAVQLLRSCGCNVIGMDLNQSLVERVECYGAKGIPVSDDTAHACMDLTSGHGVDGVLICAGTLSNDPIELSGEVTREKGRVVVVGAVGMNVPREPYFKKEISLCISRSYGPGRYDPAYEEKGSDYPFGYVRFTEQRNMQSFLALIADGKMDIQSLITHRFSLEEAAKAYKLIEGKKTESYLGIVLQYAAKSPETSVAVKRIEVTPRPVDSGKVAVSFLGAGNYATASLLPPLKGMDAVDLRGLATFSGRTAKGVAQQFGFAFCASEIEEVLSDDTVAVMIATRHNTHADFVMRALEAGKHVYVEKPLALSVDELAKIYHLFRHVEGVQLMTGYNRRFAPMTCQVRNFFSSVNIPLVVNIRINAGFIPPDHWIHDPEVGGGRMIGEGCHFVDLACALTGELPKSVYSICTARGDKSPTTQDNLCVSMVLDHGSIANITYTAEGSKAMQKEYVEVFGGGRSAIIHDWKELSLFGGDGKVSKHKASSQDKGQRNMLSAWIDGLRQGKSCLEYESQMRVALASIMAVESLTLGLPVSVTMNVLEDESEIPTSAV